jgi:hypothetical protein
MLKGYFNLIQNRVLFDQIWEIEEPDFILAS